MGHLTYNIGIGRNSFGSHLESHVNIAHLVFELNESENFYFTRFLRLWVVGGWQGGLCTEILASALLFLLLN